MVIDTITKFQPIRCQLDHEIVEKRHSTTWHRTIPERTAVVDADPTIIATWIRTYLYAPTDFKRFPRSSE
jgi:hypothetical protein